MPKLRVHDEIYQVMGDKPMTSYQIQAKLSRLYSESTITRRLREMPNVIANPPADRKKSTAWTYQVLTVN